MAMIHGRYDPGMTMKIAVSLPDSLVIEAREAVRSGRAESVSAYVAQALEEKSGRTSLAALLDQWDRELGAPDAEALAWADRALGLRS